MGGGRLAVFLHPMSNFSNCLPHVIFPLHRPTGAGVWSKCFVSLDTG